MNINNEIIKRNSDFFSLLMKKEIINNHYKKEYNFKFDNRTIFFMSWFSGRNENFIH